MLTFTARAIFWTAVVAAFVPAGFSAPEEGAFAREARAVLDRPAREGVYVAQAETARFCEAETAFCTVARELGAFAGLVGGVAANRAEQALEERLAPSEQASARSLDSVLEEVARERHAR
ncbi:MAG: hypothetical protein ABL308_09075 [Oceanicaulis sp.]